MINDNKQRTNALWIRCIYGLMGLVMLTLTGCQHIQLAHNPLPITQHSHPNANQPPYILSCKDATEKNRQTSKSCANKNKTAFYILEDWF